MGKETVLVCGCDGYIGSALTLRLLEEGYNVIGIDNLLRRDTVKEMNSFSAIPIMEMYEKEKELKKMGSFSFFYSDIAIDIEDLSFIFKNNDINTVINLAQQPSAPYSQISRIHTEETTVNNIIGTLNILYCMREFSPESHLVQIGSMGEYQVNVNTDIAEGIFEFEFNNRKSKTSIFPRRPGSFYHASKVASTYYIDCACRFWDIKATDIMQGVVYGNWTPEIERTGIQTRLDSDECFGTVINRFIVQSLIGVPLTVYGKGLHKRGFLALNDSVQCLMLAVRNIPAKGEYRTWNQLDEVFSMNEIADTVIDVSRELDFTTTKTYIDTPRVEVIDDHYYNPITEKIINLGFKQTRTMRDEIKYSFDTILKSGNNVSKLIDVVIPKIMWK